MSLGEDFRNEYAFEMDFPHGINNDEWRTREGKILKVKDMTTAHIKNCMRMIGEKDDFYYVFEDELKKRKDESKKVRYLIDREEFKRRYLCCGYLPEMSEEEFDKFPTIEMRE